MQRQATKTYHVLFMSSLHQGIPKLFEIYVRAPGPIRAAAAVRHRFGHWPKRIRRAVNADSMPDNRGPDCTNVFYWRKLWQTSTKG